MKTLTPKCIRAAALSAMLVLPALVYADDSMSSESTTTTTTSAGTVSDFTPDAITVRTTTTAAPTSYTFSKTTTYVDENGILFPWKQSIPACRDGLLHAGR